MSGKKEQKFLDALRDLFVGAKQEVLQRARHTEEPEDIFTAGQDPYARYLFMRDPKLLNETLSIEGDEVRVDLSALYPDIDLAEALSCLTGKWVRRVHAAEVEFVDSMRLPLSVPDRPSVKPLLWW